MTGAEAIINYSLDIFRRANMKWNNYVLSILVQTGSITGYFISTFLMSRIKRKVQYISTASLMAVAQIILGCTLIADVRLHIILLNYLIITSNSRVYYR